MTTGTSTIKDIKRLTEHFKYVRSMFEQIAAPLETEDFVIQSVEDVSPPKWHLAHTTWFFEQVVLESYIKNYKPYNKDYYFLFNSYYNSFGERTIRQHRGTLSRPTVEEVFTYRKEVEKRVLEFLSTVDDKVVNEVYDLIELGINHEQQHQELMLADTKWNFGENPLLPLYKKTKQSQFVDAVEHHWIPFSGGVVDIGFDSPEFSYDNEQPKHKALIHDFKLSNRLVTCGEYLEFIQDGGYEKPNLWLDEGWTMVNTQDIRKPQYWHKIDGKWQIFTLGGLKELNLHEPVCHVSMYEAAAFARWAGARLATEFEWEHASNSVEEQESNFLESDYLHPSVLTDDSPKLQQMIGDLWEWTSSAYLPYPGYKQEEGALGEYNGKFMSNQIVCRGGSCITPKSHFRNTYRNFFQPDKRWVVLGFRLAKDA
ncbi:MAG: ergothioneine biosynthesis protein EgtB [Calditrichaeota bacterium]|nr:MAG: ergothioneine biosynthesis protein EgtB [Calditrichota bacterium]